MFDCRVDFCMDATDAGCRLLGRRLAFRSGAPPHLQRMLMGVAERQACRLQRFGFVEAGLQGSHHGTTGTDQEQQRQGSQHGDGEKQPFHGDIAHTWESLFLLAECGPSLGSLAVALLSALSLDSLAGQGRRVRGRSRNRRCPACTACRRCRRPRVPCCRRYPVWRTL